MLKNQAHGKCGTYKCFCSRWLTFLFTDKRGESNFRRVIGYPPGEITVNYKVFVRFEITRTIAGTKNAGGAAILASSAKSG